MAGLKDIAPQSKECHGVTVFGISSEGIAYLIEKFPELAKLSTGASLKVSEIMNMAPNAIPAIIAAGCGNISDPDAEKVAAKFAMETQLDFLTDIGGLTFPSGLGPFVDRILALSKAVSGEVSKVRSMSLPAQLKGSSQADTARKASGD